MTTKGLRQSMFRGPDRLNRILKKRTWGIFLGIFFTAVWAGWASDARIQVYGIGYPPVKAQNKAQALLMAKRAAVLDAYRRALAGQEDQTGPHEEGKGFYRGLSGFVKGLTIITEEYLQDGGVKIEATVPKRAISLFKREKYPYPEISGTGPNRVGGPSKVSIEEWYTIIEKMVQFEGGELKRGEK